MLRWTPWLFATVLAFSQSPATDTRSPESMAWDTLRKGFADSDDDHRKQAIMAAGSIRDDPQALSLVQNTLRDKDMAIRQQAAATLGDMGSTDAIPALQLALDDSSPEVSFTAAKSLWNLGDTSVREFFWQVLTGERTDTPGFLEAAARGAKHRLKPSQLALMGAKEAAGLLGPAAIGVDAVQEMIKSQKASSSAPGRVVVAGILAKDSNPYNVTLFEWALDDDSSQVRAAVAKALGDSGTPASIPKLVPRLTDDRHAVRYMAAAAIIKLTRKRAAAPAQSSEK